MLYRSSNLVEVLRLVLQKCVSGRIRHAHPNQKRSGPGAGRDQVETGRTRSSTRPQGEAGTMESTADTMMKQFFSFMKAQQESTEAQIQAQQEAAEEERKVLFKQMIKQAGQIDALMGGLVDQKRKHSTVNSFSGPKPVAPSKLLPEISVSKFKA